MHHDIPAHNIEPSVCQLGLPAQSPDDQVPPLFASRKHPMSEAEEAKVKLIINATESRDYQALSELAASPGGLIDDEVRRVVCMLRHQGHQLDHC